MNFLNPLLSNYRDYLKKNFPQSFGYILNGELFIKIPFNKLNRICFFLLNHTNSQYKVLSDICAIDYPFRKKRFEIFYNLLSISFNSRITLQTCISEQQSLESLTIFFKVASWFERELWDMFGIFFFNHPDLRRILTDYGFKGHPLRKDFPLTGYTEVKYSFKEKRIFVDEITLAQDYRNFYFNNPWQKLF